MKKFIFGFAVLILVGIIIVSFPKQRNEDGKLKEAAAEDNVDADNWFYIETLSNKDIYFKADTLLPDNPVINDMVDVANGYAILRAAYCDAELWFRFGEVVNDTIGLLKTNVIKDKDMREAAEHYVKTLWQYIACGGRVVYHGIFDWDMKNTSVGHYADPDDRAYYRHADLLNREGIRAEEISRLLPLMTRAPIDCPVAHIFGHDRLVDWLDSGYRDWGEPIAHGLGGLGYYADAYPASEIAEGTFSVCDDGMLRVGRQRYAACVLYHLSAREREAWDSLVGHRRLTTRAFVDPGVGEVADFLSSVGAVKQIPLGDTGLWGGRINRLPPSDGVMRLADGTSVRIKGGMPDLAGDAISGVLATGGVNVKYDARGMFAARSENGVLTGICGGEVRSVEAPGFSLNLDEPADIALVKLGGEWYGIWQTSDASRPIPGKLLAITTKFVKVLTCTSAAQID